jgi:hypothetical protein
LDLYKAVKTAVDLYKAVHRYIAHPSRGRRRRRASAAMAAPGGSGLQLLQRLCNFVAKIMNDSE